MLQNNKYFYKLTRIQNKIVLVKTEGGKSVTIAERPYIKDEIVLKVKADRLNLQFMYGENENELIPVGTIQDASILSSNKAGGFTGPYIGMYGSSNGIKSKKSFAVDWFDYSGE